MTKIILTIVVGLICTAGAVIGGRALLNYENSPGAVGHISSEWPKNSALSLATDRPTLVMLAHPQCPCTRASVSELEQVVAQTRDKARVYILFYTPRDTEADWTQSGLRRSAEKIPGATVVSDIDGLEAELFGAETSGHTFLFAPGGRLLFNGGITAARGHAGDNVGESSIVSLIENQASARTRTFVFGCSLKNKSREGAKCLK